MSPRLQTQGNNLAQLLQRVEERDRASRRNAILYSLIPIAVAVVLLTLTGWQVYNAEKKVADAKKELRALESQTDVLQKAITKLNYQETPSGKVISDVTNNQQQQAQPNSSFAELLRASATPVSGQETSDQRPLYQFRLSVEGSPETLSRIARVKYQFNHPTILHPIQESSDRASNFSVGYKGWGCLRSVIVTFTLKDSAQAPPPPVAFDMCAALHWD